MNENRVFKMFPEWGGYTGCINASMDHFYSKRPTLGSVSDILSRADTCSFCGTVAKRLRERIGNNSVEGKACYLQAVELCTDSTLRGRAIPPPPKAVEKHHEPFAPRLPELENYWDRTTSRLVVVIQAKRKNRRHKQYSTGATVIEFQACCTPLATVLESLARPPATIPRYGGRLLNPKGVEADLLRFWLARCETQHGERCSGASLAPKLDPVTDLLLIDVVDNCIVEAAGDSIPRFVALSYVWGKTNKVMLTTGNAAKLAEKDALTSVELPSTIRDAISVTRNLGIRHLWIDTLCIKQDDELHKASQIAQMGSVYALATLTIIAAASDHADTGLSRVSRKPHWTTSGPIHAVHAPGVSLIPVLDSFDDFAPGPLASSIWYTRAWTMQEHFLSMRKLIFAENQVYWHCPCARWVEEVELEYGHPRGFAGYRFGWVSGDNDAFQTGLPSTGMLSSQWTFNRTYCKWELDISALLLPHHGGSSEVGGEDGPKPIALQAHPSLYRDLAIRFMHRNITADSDRLNAFVGVLAVLTALTGERFVWALPAQRFAYALTWFLPGMPRTHAVHGKSKTPLPSWTWVAWQSSCKVDLHLGELWYVCRQQRIFREAVIYQLDEAKGMREIEDQDYDPVSAPASAQPRLTHIWKQRPSAVEPSAGAAAFDLAKDCGRLVFWGSTAKLEFCRASGDAWGGHVIVPEYIKVKAEDDDRLPYGLPDMASLAPDCLVKAKGECDTHKGETIEAEVAVYGGEWSDDTEKSEEWVLYALILEWRDGVAYRIGIVTFTEYFWVHLENRVWKLLNLG